MANDGASPTMREAEVQQIEATIREAMERLHVPGVAVGIIHGDQEYVGGFGVTNVDHPLPVTSKTLFQIGSTTKTFTGTVIMQLVEQGTLDLDVPIRSYLPDLRLADEAVARAVTLRHVLTHVGGWQGDYFADLGAGDDALAKIVATLDTIPQLTPLGEVWSYNNAGFYIAGQVIEVVTNKTYEAVIKERIFEPLGMRRSFFFPADVMTYSFAVGHEVKDGVAQVTRPWPLPRSINAAGGIISDVHDQLRYARFHMGDAVTPAATPVLSPAAIALMQSPQVAVGASLAEEMGITWLLRSASDVRVVAHGGTTNGQLSAFLFVPSRHFAITVLTNADKGGALHDEVTTWALGHFLGIARSKAEPLACDLDQLQPYLGRYTSSDTTVELSIHDRGLVVQITIQNHALREADTPPPEIPPMRAALVAPDRLLILDAPMKESRAEFLRGAHRRDRLAAHGRSHPPARAVAAIWWPRCDGSAANDEHGAATVVE